MKGNTSSISRFISLILRHKPEVMNAAHRLRRWLLRFFNFWGLDVVFQ